MSRFVFDLRAAVQEEVTKVVNEMRPAIMKSVMEWLRTERKPDLYTSRQHESEDGPVNYCRVCGRKLCDK